MAVGLEVLEFNEEFKKGQMAATTSVSAGASEVAYNNNSSFDDDGDGDEKIEGIRFEDYRDESQLEHVMSLVGRDLSEPYSVFTYRYFLYRFPQLCILAVNEADEPIGCVVGKIDEEEVSIPLVIPIDEQQSSEFETTTETTTMVGYIGMLAVSEHYRRRGIGKALVQRILRRMRAKGCTSATLETEVTNVTAQRLYQDIFGFIREELLVRYYLNWNDAYRLRLWFERA